MTSSMFWLVYINHNTNKIDNNLCPTNFTYDTDWFSSLDGVEKDVGNHKLQEDGMYRFNFFELKTHWMIRTLYR